MGNCEVLVEKIDFAVSCKLEWWFRAQIHQKFEVLTAGTLLWGVSHRSAFNFEENIRKSFKFEGEIRNFLILVRNLHASMQNTGKTWSELRFSKSDSPFSLSPAFLQTEQYSERHFNIMLQLYKLQYFFGFVHFSRVYVAKYKTKNKMKQIYETG